MSSWSYSITSRLTCRRARNITSERWVDIVEEHNELAGMRLEVLETVSDPKLIVAGSAGESLALREQAPGRWLVVVYKELESDGFVITAF